MSAPELRVVWLAGPGPAGKAAFSADGRRIGRVSDVITDAATGAPLAYVLETAARGTRYMPAGLLAAESPTAIRLAPGAHAWLGRRGAHPADAIAEATAEFVIWEDFPPPA